MSLKKIIAFAMSWLLLLSAASCVNNDKEEDVTSSSLTNNTESIPDSSENPYRLDLPDVKYEGFTLKIANDALAATKYVFSGMTSGGTNGDVINDAIYSRNLQVQERFGINITEQNISTPTLRNLLNAGESEFDLALVDLDNVASLIPLSTDLNSVDSINMEMPWWDQNARNDLSIGGRLYYTYSDAIIYGLDNTRAVYFNKNIHEQLSLDDLYEMVRDGKWTMETMNRMSLQALADDGDGVWTNRDTYGFTVRAVTLCEALMVAAGIIPMQVGSDGMPNFYCFDKKDQFVDIFLDLQEIFYNDSVYYDNDTNSSDYFANGQSLFYMGVLKQGAAKFRAGEVPYGILPVPKYNEAQENYACISPNGHAMVIPFTNPDPERTGVILEALSYYSSAYYSDTALMPSYFSITLQGKTAQDEGSYQSLQIIHDNSIYLLKYTGTSLIFSLSNCFEKGLTNIASLLKQLERSQITALDKFFDNIEQ